MDAINWNRITDPIDKTVWDRLTANFWLPEKIAVSNDIQSWNSLDQANQKLVKRVFASLTMLDTLQSAVGAPTLAAHAATQHEEAVYSNITFMEAVHAKSYSTIFSTLCSTEEIDDVFRWANHDPDLQKLADTIDRYYRGADQDPVMAFAASVFLESMLFYTGFFAPLKYASRGILTNTADIIRLILRDEGVHGFYIGYKAQRLPGFEQHKEQILQLCADLFHAEYQRVFTLYDEVGWSEDVICFLRYNANKALANLGLPPMFSSSQTRIPSYILAALDLTTNEAHDFFSGAGASYVIGRAEDTLDEDWI